MKEVALALLLTLAACGGGGSSGSAADKVPVVVAGGSRSWAAVTIHTAAVSADVPADLRAKFTPLLATRLLDRPAPLPEYGLDRPQATLSYRSPTGSTVDVDIGQPNFDRHFVYAQRRGRPGVYLLPADGLRPVLALVGIDVQPPD